MITKAQRQYLKGLANPLKATVIIGKIGMSDTVIQSIEDYLTAHEMVKIDVLKSCESTAAELSVELAGVTHSEIVCQLGHKIVLYRYSREHNSIHLPK